MSLAKISLIGVKVGIIVLMKLTINDRTPHKYDLRNRITVADSGAEALQAVEQYLDPYKVKTHYRKTSHLNPAQKLFAGVYARTGNASQAVREAYPDRQLTNGSVRTTAWRMLTNDDIRLDIDAQREKIADLSAKGLHRLDEIITSGKEHNALTASVFVVEQTLGKAKQMVEVKSAHVIISYNLGGDSTPDIPQEVLDQLAE